MGRRRGGLPCRCDRYRVFESPQFRPAPYAGAALFGLLVGATELVSRYRDKPTAPLATLPGVIYILVNTTAAIAALWILRENDFGIDFGLLPQPLGQVLLAGFGTMALFRSAFFTLRVGEADVAIGPAAVLQVILNAADRACDRLRAGPRSEHVMRIMRGVSFERAKEALPLHCFALMQNVGAAEQAQLIQSVKTLGSSGMTDEIRAYNLGLIMMNVVGEEVLERAVRALGPLILGPASDEPPVLAQAASISFADTLALVDLCVALDPLARQQNAQSIRDGLTAATAHIESESDKNVVLLTWLRSRFGATTLFDALKLLQAGRRKATRSAAPLNLSDLQPGPQQPSQAGGAAGPQPQSP